MSRIVLKLALLAYLTGLYGSGFGRKVAAGTLEWQRGKAETKFAKPAAVWLAICTVEVKESDNGSTITEVKYPGYARLELKPADISEATEAQPSVIEYPLLEKLFPAIASEGGTIISWVLCNAATLGLNIDFGQCTSTAVSSAASPPTVPAKAIKVELKAT